MSSTGQAVGGVVGAVIGFYVGGPSGAYYGAQAGMMIGGLIDPTKVMGPRLDDLTAQTSTYGAFIPRIYGTAPIVGNIFWIQGNSLIEREAESSGKGGPEVTNFDYFATFAVGLCEGPISGVRRIWIGGQLWYDAGSSDLATIIAGNESAAVFTLYTGSDTQLADPLIQADHGVANVPAYRGLAYIVFHELPLKGYGNSLAAAQVKVEVVSPGVATAAEFRLPTAPNWPGTNNPNWNISTCVTQGLNPPTILVGQWDNSYIGFDVIEYEVFPDVLVDKGKFTAVSNQPFCLGRPDIPGIVVRHDWYEYKHYWQTKDSLVEIETTGLGQVIGLTQGRYLKEDQDLFIGSQLAPYYIFRFVLGLSGATFIAKYTGLGYPIASIDADQTYLYVLIYPSVGNGKIVRLDKADMSLNGSVNIDRQIFANAVIQVHSETEIYIFTDNKLYRTNFATGITSLLFTTTVAGATYVNISVTSGGSGFMVCNVEDAATGRFASSVVMTDIFNGSTVALSAIVQSEALKSGLLTAADLDVTDLTDQVRGYRVSSLAPLRGGIDPLRKAWPFDVIQHGYKIKFKRRGGASVATITSAELDARAAGSDPGVQITNVREMDLVLPNQLTAKYLDSAREYDVNVAEESRQ